MQIHLLGPLEVVRDGAQVDLGRRHHRLLLARLLVDPGRAVSTDRLVEDLWAGVPPVGAVASLQSYVSRMRRLLEPDRAPREPSRILVTTPAGYALHIEPDAVDACRFEALAHDGHELLAAGDPGRALQQLEAAVAAWRGPVLADLADAPFVSPLATRLDERRREALADRAAARMALGDLASAVAELDRLVTEDALDERPWALLVSALHLAGRSGEALQRMRQVREVLAEELGLDPGPMLQDIERAILDGAALPEHRSARGDVGSGARRPRRDTTADAAGLCGRQAELRRLCDLVDEAHAGCTRWTVVAGEPGIGKTRLVEELAAQATRRGMHVGWGRVHEESGAPAMWPWVQILRDIEVLVPDSAGLLGPQPRGEVGSTGDVFAVYDRVATAMTLAARQTPLLCVIDDLQWADQESLGLLAFLAVQLRQVPITVAVTVRSTDGGPQLARTLTTLARTQGALRLDLEGLDPEATVQLTRQISGTELGADRAAALHIRTGGNPFFVTELARLGGEQPTTAVPVTVRAVLARRLEAVPEATASLMSLAAVAGIEVGLDLLSAACGQEVGPMLDRLGPALDAGLMVADEGTTLRFPHALQRDAVLADLSIGQRRRLHLRLASAARELSSDPTFAVAEVAHHLVEAGPLGDTAAALDAVWTAVDHATRRLAFHEAARWAERGLQVIEGDRRADPCERYRFLLAAGCALADGGEREHGLRRLAEAVEAAEAIGDAQAMAAGAIAFGRAGGMWYWMEYHTRPTRLLALLERTLEALGPEDSPERVRVLGVRAIGEYYADPARARALAAEALEAARRLDDPDLVIDALLTAVMAGWGPGDVDGLIVRSLELLDLAVVHDRPDVQLAAHVNLYVHRLVTGDIRGAESAHGNAWELAHRMGLVLVVAQLGWGRSVLSQARGRLDEVEGLIDEARRLHERTQLYALDVAHDQQMVLLRWEQDRLTEVADRMGHSLGWADLDPHAVRALLAGRVDRDLRRRMVDLAGQSIPPSYESLGALVLRARLIGDSGLVDAARVMVPQLIPFEGRWGSMGTVASAGPVDLQLGRLRALLGDVGDARRLLQRCRDHCRSQGLPLWQAHCERELTALG